MIYCIRQCVYIVIILQRCPFSLVLSLCLVTETAYYVVVYCVKTLIDKIHALRAPFGDPHLKLSGFPVKSKRAFIMSVVDIPSASNDLAFIRHIYVLLI